MKMITTHTDARRFEIINENTQEFATAIVKLRESVEQIEKKLAEIETKSTPEATLRFNLNDEDDARAFNLCNKASDMDSLLFAFEQLLRQFRKYGVHETTTLADVTANELFDHIDDAYFALKQEYGIGDVG